MALVVGIMSLWLSWVYAGDMGILNYYTRLTWFPITSYLLIIGPALYFYVLKRIDPDLKMGKRQWLHFSPLLLELTFHGFQVYESSQTGQPIHRTMTFELISPFFQLFAIISVAIYVLRAVRKIEEFTQKLRENYSNSEKYTLDWLKRVIRFFGLMWFLWLPYTLVDYLLFNYELNFKYYYPLYLLMGVVSVWMGVEAFLRPEYIIVTLKKNENAQKKSPPIDDIVSKMDELKREMEQNRWYLNPELTLNALSENLGMHPHLLSRIINEGSGKNFSDFINEYRVNAVIEKMKSPKYQNITLLGMAHESGFNSKTSFYRTFKKFTDKTPSDYVKASN